MAGTPDPSQAGGLPDGNATDSVVSLGGSTQSRGDYLPQELVVSIMEKVYHDVDGTSQFTLSACSLTCRRWTACAQSFYLRDIVIDSAEDLCCSKKIHGWAALFKT